MLRCLILLLCCGLCETQGFFAQRLFAQGRAERRMLKTESVGLEDIQQTLMTISPETTFITSPLDEQGFPDYLEYLNLELGQGQIKPEENAAIYIMAIFGPNLAGASPVYLKQVYTRLGVPPLPEQDAYYIRPYEHIRQLLKIKRPAAGPKEIGEAVNDINKLWPSYRPWVSAQHPEMSSYLNRPESRRALQLIELACSKTVYSMPYCFPDDQAQSLVNIILPYTNSSRELVRLLLAQATLDIGERRYEDASRRLFQAHQLARLMSNQLTIIEQLVAIALESMVCNVDVHFAQTTGVPPEVIDAYEAKLRTLPPLGDMSRALHVAERSFSLNALCLLAQGQLPGASRKSEMQRELFGNNVPNLVVGHLFSQSIDWDIALKTVNTYFDKVVAAANLPAFEQAKAFDQLDQELIVMREHSQSNLFLLSYLASSKAQRGRQLSETLLSIIAPAAQQAAVAETRIQMKSQLTLIAFALERYRRQSGSYPTTLNELTPEFLTEVPLDVFNNKPLNYQSTGERYTLYSVGHLPEQTGTPKSGVYLTSEGVPE